MMNSEDEPSRALRTLLGGGNAARNVRLTRRTLVAGGAALGLLSILAACGGDDDEQPAATTTAAAAAPTATTAAAEPTAPQATPTAAAAAATPTPAAAEPTSSAAAWSFEDDRGEIITLPAMPTRIVAQTTVGAALWDLGIKPIAIFGPYKTADGEADFQAGNMDLEQVEWLGDYGELDQEKLAALDAEVYVDFTWGEGALWYLDEELEAQVERIVPTIGISFENRSIIETIGRLEDLAVALGVDLDAPQLVEDRETFAAAEDDLKLAIQETPGLTVLVISPEQTQVYVASPRYMNDLHYFSDLGLDIVDHGLDDFWEIISWEQINKYPADRILLDSRAGIMTEDEFSTIGTWAALPAVQAKQVGPWYAAAPYSYIGLVPIMEDLAAQIRASDPDLV